MLTMLRGCGVYKFYVVNNEKKMSNCDVNEENDVNKISNKRYIYNVDSMSSSIPVNVKLKVHYCDTMLTN